MSSLATALALAAVSTLPPAFVGLLAGYLLRSPTSNRSSDRPLVLTSVAVGLMVWYFLDIMADSTFLGVNQGLSLTTFTLVVLFITGLFATVYAEPKSLTEKSYDPLFLAASIIGVHSIGEGIAMGSTLTGPLDPIIAVGGPLSALSFVIHKALEAFIVSMLAVTAGRYYSHLVEAGLIIGIPTIMGAALGYSATPIIIGTTPDYLAFPNATFFFALGGGASLWLLSTLLSRSLGLQSRAKWAVALAVGVMLMFLAGILHSG